MSKTSEYDTEFLRGLMFVKNKKPSDMQQILGIAYNSVCRKLQGTSPYKQEEMYKIGLWLEMTDAEFRKAFFKLK